jgi:hypothetical protein
MFDFTFGLRSFAHAFYYTFHVTARCTTRCSFTLRCTRSHVAFRCCFVWVCVYISRYLFSVAVRCMFDALHTASRFVATRLRFVPFAFHTFGYLPRFTRLLLPCYLFTLFVAFIFYFVHVAIRLSLRLS